MAEVQTRLRQGVAAMAAPDLVISAETLAQQRRAFNMENESDSGYFNEVWTDEGAVTVTEYSTDRRPLREFSLTREEVLERCHSGDEDWPVLLPGVGAYSQPEE
jgi:hypothetical protein